MAEPDDPNTVSRSVDIAAPPDRVYALISDLPRMGEWSPECYRCDWKSGASSAAVGARFRGHNRIGPLRWSTTGEVVVADQDRAIAFEVSLLGLSVARWSYEIEPLDDHQVRLTETWVEQRSLPVKIIGMGTGVLDRKAHNAAGMEKTLQRIKETAEAD